MIKLNAVNRAEALRYLGKAKSAEIPPEMEILIGECESDLLKAVCAKYIYRAVDLPFEGLVRGEDIKRHLKDCEKAVLLCATLGSGVDALIRRESVGRMDRAVVLDALASAAVEQVCDLAEEEISAAFSDYYMTWRFSCGYGDYPIETQGLFLRVLNAEKKIGVCTADSSVLEPTKSVTAVIGLSRTEPERRRRGCAVCNMREVCKFRKEGLRCEF